MPWLRPACARCAFASILKAPRPLFSKGARVISQLKRGYNFLGARPGIRITFQAAVSLLLIAALVFLAQRSNMLASLSMLDSRVLMLAGGLQLVAFLINGRRWQILLEHFGIRERLATLTTLYF